MSLFVISPLDYVRRAGQGEEHIKSGAAVEGKATESGSRLPALRPRAMHTLGHEPERNKLAVVCA
jgi:hypothetical protein